MTKDKEQLLKRIDDLQITPMEIDGRTVETVIHEGNDLLIQFVGGKLLYVTSEGYELDNLACDVQPPKELLRKINAITDDELYGLMTKAERRQYESTLAAERKEYERLKRKFEAWPPNVRKFES